MDGFEQGEDIGIGVVVGNADQGHQIGATGQRVAQKVPAMGLDALAHAVLIDLLLGYGSDLRQVEQVQSQVAGMLGQAAHKTAFAPAHVEHLLVGVKVVCGQHLVNHKRLGSRHQLGVARHFVVLPRAGAILVGVLRVRPVSGHFALRHLVAQQGHGVVHVVVERRVVLDHGAQTGVPGHRRAQGPQAVAIGATPLEQPQGHRRLQQALQGMGRDLAHQRQLLQAARGLGHFFQNLKAHASQQDLRIDKTSHQVKHLARAALGDPACEGVGHAPAVHGAGGEPSIPPAVDGVAPSGSLGQGTHVMGEVQCFHGGVVELGA